MPKLKRKNKGFALRAARARQGKAKSDDGLVTSENTFCIFPIDFVNHDRINNKMFDTEGRLRQEVLEKDVIGVEPIHFTEKVDGKGCPDIRYQLVVLQDGDLWNEIKEMMKSDPQRVINFDEIDTIKILIGGSRDQILHNDLKFKKNIRKENIIAIQDQSWSVLISCDLYHPVRLNVLATQMENESDWEDCEKAFLESSNSARIMTHVTDQRVKVMCANALAFDATVCHAGTPCVGAYSEGAGKNQFSGPFSSLKKKAESSEKKNVYRKLQKEDFADIKKLNSICRIFVATWPKSERSARSSYVAVTNVAPLSNDYVI